MRPRRVDTASCSSLHLTSLRRPTPRERTCPHHELLVMILCNATSSDLGCESMLQLDRERLEGVHIAVLLRLLVDK